MNNCFVNGTKSLTFRELNGYFFYYDHLSSAQLDHWQAPMQLPIMDQHPVEETAYRREIKGLVTMDINLSLQFLGWYVKETGLG